MSKRVFVAEVSFSVPVLAETADEAAELARDEYANREWRDGGARFNCEIAGAWEMTKPQKGWEDTIPWGEEDDRTIADILAPRAAGKEPR